jgi:hypothetical protein
MLEKIKSAIRNSKIGALVDKVLGKPSIPPHHPKQFRYCNPEKIAKINIDPKKYDRITKDKLRNSLNLSKQDTKSIKRAE